MKNRKVMRRPMWLDGEMVTITVVQGSKLCRWFSKKKVLLIGHTLYCADDVVRMKDLFRVIGKLQRRRSLLDKLINLMYF